MSRCMGSIVTRQVSCLSIGSVEAKYIVLKGYNSYFSLWSLFLVPVPFLHILGFFLLKCVYPLWGLIVCAIPPLWTRVIVSDVCKVVNPSWSFKFQARPVASMPVSLSIFSAPILPVASQRSTDFFFTSLSPNLFSVCFVWRVFPGYLIDRNIKTASLILFYFIFLNNIMNKFAINKYSFKM